MTVVQLTPIKYLNPIWQVEQKKTSLSHLGWVTYLSMQHQLEWKRFPVKRRRPFRCNTPFLLVSITQIADMENLDKKAIKYLGLFSPHPDPDLWPLPQKQHPQQPPICHQTLSSSSSSSTRAIGRAALLSHSELLGYLGFHKQKIDVQSISW